LKDEFQDWASYFRKVADKHGARLAIIRCKAPSEKELKKRLKQRGYVWDKWKLENWNKFKELEPEDFPIPHDDVYEAITNKPVDELTREVIRNYLRGKLIG
jgi:arsenate reductase-like glutaredoxin family protein